MDPGAVSRSKNGYRLAIEIASANWTQSTYAMIALRNGSQLADHVVSWIKDQGIVVSAGSRIDQMRAMFVRPNGEPPPFIAPGDKGFEVALEAERDLQMLGFAGDQLAKVPLPPEFQTRLKRLSKDTALPQDGSANTVGRDLQCELYVAAICMKAGTSPTFDEPDVRCAVNGLKFGVAVKRVKSPGRFEDRVREAEKQIEKVGLPGIVVADISVMLNPTNERIIQPVTDEVYGAAANAMMHKFVNDRYDQLLEWFKCSPARLDSHRPSRSAASGRWMGTRFDDFWRESLAVQSVPKTRV